MSTKADPPRTQRLAAQWVDRWAGQTVVCIASGPSLTTDDCDLVHAAGLPTIVTNTSFRRAPWADVLFAHDVRWWQIHGEQVREQFAGERITCSQLHSQYGVTSLYGQPWFTVFANSGAAAISLAIAAGAARVVLIGYDCQAIDGRLHWHDAHQKPLSDAISIRNWPRIFKNVAKLATAKGVRIENASRDTALQCFARVDLGQALAQEMA